MEKNLIELLNKVTSGVKDQLLLFSLAVIILFLLLPERYDWPVFLFYIVAVVAYVLIARKKSTSNAEEVEERLSVHIDSLRSNLGRTLMAEILNTGTEDILNLEVSIKWNQFNQGRQNRQLQRFYRENEDPVRSSASQIRTLRSSERIFAEEIPRYSTDGKVEITVVGIGSISNKTLEYVASIQNEVMNSE